MPVRGKDDEFDAKELGHRSEWYKVVMHAYPKQAKIIQAQSHADVINQAAPEVSRPEANVALLIDTSCLHDDGTDGENGL